MCLTRGADLQWGTFAQQPAYNMNSEMEMYYATNKLFLYRIGVWPYQRRVLKVMIPCFIVIVHISVVISEALLLYDTWGDINVAVDCIVNLILLFTADVKLINMVVNNRKVSGQVDIGNVYLLLLLLLLLFVLFIVNQFRRLLELMNKHWELLNNKIESHILKYYASISQKLTSYYAVYLIVIIIFYLLIPLTPKILDFVVPLNESRPLAYIYQGEYRVDKEKYYYPILFHSYLATACTMTILFTCDTTYIICVLHACSLFTAIGEQLENITSKAGTTSNNDGEIHTEMQYHTFIKKHSFIGNDYKILITCLKKHQLAVENAQTLNSMFLHVTFILLSMNMLVLSIIGIQLINNLENTKETIRYICLTGATFIHLVCMCIPGQLLIDKSTEILDKTYGSEWYTFSNKTKKLLSVLLYKSLVPCTLTAGKMFVMSMTLCSSIDIQF
ncbi:uncharacterized protein LOC105193345 isoform X2 [Solenopsis invicta]|uniref:uncharacterized protein LOC105193345 isoform X2 n=1 Tax=Solenopsis invicta TaxID=13686 RepID=UPI00193D8613|nr:uncharacterized protein LOC105193345 isoform X2 [Solenopsis invicta]